MERVQIRLRGDLQLLSVRKSCKSVLMRMLALSHEGRCPGEV